MLYSYLELNFDVLHAATGNRYVENNVIRLVNLGPIVLFSIYELTSSSGKHLEDIYHTHIVSLMYKLITSSRGSDDLSIGFDRDRKRNQRKLTNSKTQKGKFHFRTYSKYIFGFAEHQGKATYGLGYKVTLTRNTKNAVLNKDNAINAAQVKIIATERYLPHYTPSIQQQAILSKQILNKTPTELKYVERSVFMKEVDTPNFWTFELGTQEGINLPIWIFVGFKQRDRQDSQNLNIDTIYRAPVASAQ